MSKQWFRLYAEVLNDPKVQKLDGETFKAWINLMCLASETDGILPGFEEIAFALRIDGNGARTLVERLSNATLIDRLNGGVNGIRYALHGWTKRQYKSDTSTERVKRFRAVSKSLRETPPDTDTDTDIPLSKDNGQNRVQMDPEQAFWRDAKTFIVRSGKSEAQAGSIVGKWLRDHGKELTRSAVHAAQIERAVDPIAFCGGFFRRHGNPPTPPLTEGPC